MGNQDTVLGRVVRGAKDWTTITAGESGARVLRSPDERSYAKVATAAGREDLAGERDRIAWLSRTGIGGPAVLDWSSDDDGACLVMTAVPGIPANLLDVEKLSAVWPHLAEMVRDVHELSPDDCPFRRDLAAMMDRARDVVAKNLVATELLPVELQDLPVQDVLERLESAYGERLADERVETVVCHGDLCLPNVMVDPETARVTGFVGVGRLGLADPYADIALLLASARETWPDDDSARGADAVFATRYGASLDAGRRRFYQWLDPLTRYA
ncbi:APH(3'') family aminoglycoside O-phosphotransferase [Georgenia halophila]|uniref:APH(3'') family aminoglycoside O-phosphotransferase n=1 Tax=Georgenia halophila TaxID=620889 RepID=A0ABP8L8Z9_9MICO